MRVRLLLEQPLGVGEVGLPLGAHLLLRGRRVQRVEQLVLERLQLLAEVALLLLRLRAARLLGFQVLGKLEGRPEVSGLLDLGGNMNSFVLT
jgi:hypothetical protein